MSSQENLQKPQGDFETHPQIYGTTEMESIDLEKHDPEYHLAHETLSTPRSLQSTRSVRSRASSEAVDRSTRDRSPAKTIRSKIIRPQPHNSSIPLPMKFSGPIKPPLTKTGKTPISKIVCKPPPSRGLNTSANKHTLEIQYINKNKRFLQLKKDLVDKQKPVIEMYQGLMAIKKKLEQLGKNVKLEEVKLVPFGDFFKPDDAPDNTMMRGAGEQMTLEVVSNMKTSIEEIPKTLMEICKNLLSRRALIVELLESVTKSEVDVGLVSEKIASLKCEGQQLEKSLDLVINEQEMKICDLVQNWQKLLSEKQSNSNTTKIEELENKLKEEQKLKEESENVILELHKKIDERKTFQDKSLIEMNGVVNSLKEQIKKLDQDLENERKATVEFKSRNNANAQTLKNLRARVNELESQSSDKDSSNAELQKKLRLLQDQMKHKEVVWAKEKEDMAKNLKHQENLLQKITAEKNQFETRLVSVEEENEGDKREMQEQFSSLKEKLLTTQADLEKVTLEKNEAVEKREEYEQYISRMSSNCKETMNKVSCSIEWGNASRHISSPEAENYVQDVVKDLRIMELEDKLNQMEQEKIKTDLIKGKSKMDFVRPSVIEHELDKQRDLVKRYQMLLEDSEKKLKHKLHNLRTVEIEKLHTQIQELKLRQEKYEQENGLYSMQALNQMVEDGKREMTGIMHRFVQSEDKVEDLKTLIAKQKHQMNEMGNLLKYKENLINVLKTTRAQLLHDKNSLGRYAKEIKTMLVEVSANCTQKDEKVNYLEKKISSRENQIAYLQSNVEGLEEKLQLANNKRHKLQVTISRQERELQQSSEKIAKLKYKSYKSSGNSSWGFLDSVCEEDDKPNKKLIKHYSNSLMQSSNESNFEPVIPCPMQTIPDKFNNLLNKDTISNCYPNTKALLGRSLQTIDVVTTRLNFLTSLTAESLFTNDNPINLDSDNFNSQFFKMYKLAAHRHEYMQNQAQESYQDLTNLLKFAITQSSSRGSHTQTK